MTMQFQATAVSAGQRRTACAVVGVYEHAEMTEAAHALDRRCRHALSRWLRRGDFHGRLAEVQMLPDLAGVTAERVLLVGLGERRRFNRRSYRKALAAAAQWLVKSAARDATVHLSQEKIADTDAYYAARVAVEVFSQARYRVPDLKSARRPAPPRLAKVAIAVPADGLPRARRGVADGLALCEGVTLARDLGNLPANVCTPTHLANTARALDRAHRAVRTRVLAAPELRRLKMGSFLSVTRGSDEPPRLVVVEYRGGTRGEAPVALVGKGITFDTGGISLKDPAAMDEMKFDMSGAGSVLGVIKALAAAGARINVVGVIAACENMPSGRATKPGDIVTSMSGKTIEVLNTDAEGRLVLCDAITYARRFKPRAVVDIATLTGACVVALGAHYQGLFTPDDELAQQLVAAGERADDRAWRMPVAEEYAEQLKSNFADFANVAGRDGGAVTAACFLWKFTDGLRWAHLDIAGTAWLGGANKGSTGRPVPMLVDWLLQQG
ncbi:MAG: leucyl aminopeptidase [Steroidobacteraceae bacterium]